MNDVGSDWTAPTCSVKRDSTVFFDEHIETHGLNDQQVMVAEDGAQVVPESMLPLFVPEARDTVVGRPVFCQKIITPRMSDNDSGPAAKS